jgi:ABC-type nitrate/sulfonate/bicarbonate transport system substrate-binding protein
VPDPISRRTFFGRAASLGAGVAVLGAAGPLLSACSSSDADTSSGGSTGSASGGPNPSVTYQLGWLMDEQFSGEYLADQNGYWSAAGVDVSLLAGGPNVNSLAVVETGRADITIAQPDGVAKAIDNGGRFKIIGTKYQKAPYALTSLASSPIDGPEDLEGKTIGVTANNTLLWATFLDLNDIDPASVTVVPVQYDPAPLAAGEVDGWLSFVTDEPVALEVQGVETTSFLFYDHGYTSIAGCYVITEQSYDDEERRTALTNFMLGDVQGWQDAIADPQAAVDLALGSWSADLEIAPEKALATLEATNDLITARGAGTDRGVFTLDAEGIDGSLAAVEATGATLDRAVFVPSLLDELFDGRTEL